MNISFGEFLKQKRQEKRLTQKQLAEILYVSESAVSKWEKDVAHPDISLLSKLSQTLGVSEHELITASIDEKSREEKAQAKKWRTLTFSWNLFFLISYALTLIPCFICDLAINKSLTWFWIVLSALILAFCFTNLPIIVKKHKLLILPAATYTSLILLLGVCAIYTNGNWFGIAAMAILLAVIMVFAPVYISKYNVFEKIKKYGDFVSVTTDFVFVNLLLMIIENYCVANGFSTNHWYLKIALPITLALYAIINILLCVKFLKLNKLLKTSIILLLINMFIYIPPMFIKFKDTNLQQEINEINILKANFSHWQAGVTLEQNVHLIIFLSLLGLALTFLAFGLIKVLKRKK